MVRLFPLLILGILIAYMDRANLAVVKTPMSEDLGLTATAFGLAAGVFYLGYLFLEIPSNIALHKFGARIWLARIMFSWGAVTVGFLFIQGPTGLNILRFLLGVAEAGFYPGVILYLTFWFPGRLFSRAFSTFQLGVPIALAVTTLITSAILLMDGVLGLAGWRWVFLLQGVATLVLGVVYLIFLPSSPKKAKWLTHREREYILEQVAATNPGGSAHEAGAFKKVARNGLAWTYALLYFCVLMAFWTITYWLPSVIADRFGVGAVQAGFLSAIPWAFCALVMYLAGLSAARTGDRRWHVVVGLSIGGIGLLMSTMVSSPILVLICLCFAAAGAQAILPLFFAQASAAFIGTASAVAIAFINSLGNVSGFVGPYAIGLLTDITGNTRLGLAIMSVFFLFGALLMLYVTRKPQKPTIQPVTSSTPTEAVT